METETKRGRGRPRKIAGKHSKDKDYVQAYSKTYYQQNREKLLTNMKTKVQCPECGTFCNRSHLDSHKQSMRCLRLSYVDKEDKVKMLLQQFYNLKEQFEVKRFSVIKNRLKEVQTELNEIMCS